MPGAIAVLAHQRPIFGVSSRLAGFVRFALLAALVGMTAACTSQKAEVLRLSANQFNIATNQAITAMDTLRSAQIASPPRSESQTRDSFIQNALSFKGQVPASAIDILSDPDAVKIDPGLQAKWQDEIDTLRANYQDFSAIFTALPQGSFVAGPAVRKSGPILQRLRARLARLGQNVANQPPVFILKRSGLVAELNKIRNDKTLAPAQKRQELQGWWQKWQTLLNAEQTVRHRTLVRFANALQTGARLQEQINNYDRLDMASFLGGIREAMEFSGQIDGFDTSRLGQTIEKYASPLLAQVPMKPDTSPTDRPVNNTPASAAPAN